MLNFLKNHMFNNNFNCGRNTKIIPVYETFWWHLRFIWAKYLRWMYPTKRILAQHMFFRKIHIDLSPFNGSYRNILLFPSSYGMSIILTWKVPLYGQLRFILRVRRWCNLASVHKTTSSAVTGRPDVSSYVIWSKRYRIRCPEKSSVVITEIRP